ncbi:50S ribosomal protein L23 [Candidatus Parcubacteria bacterium]|nr:MAG: 50S ribosomal protein L23 [Candidatus Parcubacteria bacterium]
MAIFKKGQTADKGKEDKKEKKTGAKASDNKTTETKKAVDKAKQQNKATAEKKTKKAKIFRGSGILLAPVITEKTAQMSDDHRIVFFVDRKANRVQIKNEIKAVYGILPERVNIINYRGKRVSFGRVEGKRKDVKKAIITLPKGKSIDIFEGV